MVGSPEDKSRRALEMGLLPEHLLFGESSEAQPAKAGCCLCVHSASKVQL